LECKEKDNEKNNCMQLHAIAGKIKIKKNININININIKKKRKKKKKKRTIFLRKRKRRRTKPSVGEVGFAFLKKRKFFL